MTYELKFCCYCLGNILQLATSLGETELVTYLNKTGLATSVSEISKFTNNLLSYEI